MSKRALKDADDDDGEDSFESLSEEEIPHPAKISKHSGKMKPVGAPISDITFVEVAPLKQRRRQVGVLPDDGSNKREDSIADQVYRLYGHQWLDEAIARQRLLNADVNYRFASLVSGGANSTLETFLKETEISRETRARVAAATQALVERRRSQQDTTGEQNRAKALRTEIDQLVKQRQELLQNWAELQDVQQCIVDALNKVNAKRLVFSLPDGTPLAPEGQARNEGFARLFDFITRASVARFGPQQYDRSLDIFKTAVQVLHGKLLSDAAVGTPAVKTRIGNEMPRSSELALHWSVLLGIYLKADLMHRVAQNAAKFFPKGSVYEKQPELYAEDLRSLGLIMYTLPDKRPTDNLLTLDKITLFLWRILNLMIERAAPDAKQAELLGRPTTIVEPRQAGAGRRREVIINNILVVIDVPDEDLRAAVMGQDVYGVDRDQLAAARSTLHNNIDQARTSAVINSLLEPMLKSVWRYLFYTKDPLDNGLDEEAFAGGFYYGGRVVEMFEGSDQLTPGIRSIVGLAGFATVLFELSLSAPPNWVFLGQNSVEDIFRSVGARFDMLKEVFESVFAVSAPSREAYEKQILGRYLRLEKFLDCFAHAVILLRSFRLALGVSASDLAVLTNYHDAVAAGKGVPGSRSDLAFSKLEDDAMRAFESGTFQGQLLYSVAQLKQTFAAIKFTDLQWKNVSSVLQPRAAEAYMQSQTNLLANRANLLTGQEKSINDRMNVWLAQTVQDEQALLREIIENGAGVSTENLLSPLNTGYLFFTEVYKSALDYAYMMIEDFLPCVAKVYTAQELVESEAYQVRYASLVNSMLRIIDARNPRQYKPDRTELRARIELVNPLDSMRRVAARDRAVRHACSGSCGGVGGGFGGDFAQDVTFNYRTVYPLAPSVQVSRGAF